MKKVEEKKVWSIYWSVTFISPDWDSFKHTVVAIWHSGSYGELLPSTDHFWNQIL